MPPLTRNMQRYQPSHLGQAGILFTLHIKNRRTGSPHTAVDGLFAEQVAVCPGAADQHYWSGSHLIQPILRHRPQ